MKPPKESQSARKQRLAETEGGRRFRSKTWSAKGNIKDKKKMRRNWNSKEKRQY